MRLKYKGDDTECLKCGEVYDVDAVTKNRGVDPEDWQIIEAVPVKPVKVKKSAKAVSDGGNVPEL